MAMAAYLGNMALHTRQHVMHDSNISIFYLYLTTAVEPYCVACTPPLLKKAQSLRVVSLTIIYGCRSAQAVLRSLYTSAFGESTIPANRILNYNARPHGPSVADIHFKF